MLGLYFASVSRADFSRVFAAVPLVLGFSQARGASMARMHGRCCYRDRWGLWYGFRNLCYFLGLFHSTGLGGGVWCAAFVTGVVAVGVVGDCLDHRVARGFPCSPARSRILTLGLLSGFLLSRRSSSLLLLGKCTKANGASLIKTLIGAVTRLGRGDVLLTPAKQTTGMFSNCTKRGTFAVRGGVCHRGTFSGRPANFRPTSGLRGSALFVMSRTSVVTGRKLSSFIFKAKHLLSSLIRCICSKRGYHLVLVNSITRLPPIVRARDPTLGPRALQKCGLGIRRVALARIIHRDRGSKVLFGTAHLQSTLQGKAIRVFPGLELGNFASFEGMGKSRLVRRVSSTCDQSKVRRAVVVSHSGGQTALCGGNVHGHVLCHRRRLSSNSQLVVTGGGCF